MQREPALDPQKLAAIRAPFDRLGGARIEASVLQPLSLLIDLAGESLRARLFVVQADGAEEMALRPDFTIPVVETHIASQAVSGLYRYEGAAFLLAEPGSDQPSEFLQIGAERFGVSDDPLDDDAALAALAFEAASAGGRQDLELRLGDPALFAGFVAALGVAPPTAARLVRAFRSQRALHQELTPDRQPAAASEGSDLSDILAKMSEKDAARLLGEVWRLSGVQPVGGRTAEDIIHRLALRAEAARAPNLTAGQSDLLRRFLQLSDRPGRVLDAIAGLAKEAGAELDLLLDTWAKRLAKLEARLAPQWGGVHLATAFVRPFGYYDGMVFDVESRALGPDLPVAAGGRYDALVSRLGGQPGAVGCMVRPGRAILGLRP